MGGAAIRQRPASAPVAAGADGRTWAAHAAAVWAFAFAALSFYWAAGGTIGLAAVGGTIEGTARSHEWFTSIVSLTALAKAVGGMLALSLVRTWGERIPRTVRLAASTAAGALLAVYALLNLGARALQAVGIVATPASMHSAAAWWHLLLWDPWFLAGGVLFLAAAWQFHLASRRERA
ncbi:MAG: DUF3995 domain-containing protein [Streptosporangiales bacterium]|nr:DUF3995 domain-containing protein [Streptosporangiales bacterium]